MNESGDTATHPSADRLEAILACLNQSKGRLTTPASSVVGLRLKGTACCPMLLSAYWIDAQYAHWDVRALRPADEI